MSMHYIYIQCPRCGKTESIYTGDKDTEEFNSTDWEGETILTKCIECLNKIEKEESHE